MKFKRNFLLTLNLNLFVFLLITCPIIMIMLSFINEAKNALLMIPAFVIILFVFTLVCNLINVFTWMFSKKDIYIDKKTIIYENKSVNFHEIDKIYFEFGLVGKTGFNNPCTLYLYSKNNPILKIVHPSFLSVLVTIAKCKKIPKRLHHKGLLIASATLYSLAFLIAIVACL